MKPYVYSPIPEFDQKTQYVTQMTPIDMGDHWFIGIEIRGVVQQDTSHNLMPPMESQGD